jgi:hypothetical protein
MLGVALALVVVAAADAPVMIALSPDIGGAIEAANPSEIPQSLIEARRMADDLRYEEAVVEYQRYLGDRERPVKERAKALLELGFIHLILGDEVSAEQRAAEALELDPSLKLPSNAPSKQLQFLEAMRKKLAGQARLEILPRSDGDSPSQVHATLSDPNGAAKRVLIRHGISPKGPFYSTAMRCGASGCDGEIPPPSGGEGFTAYYYLEALDAEGNTVAQAASPTEPLQLSVVGRGAWYKSPWVWGLTGAALVAVAGVVFITSPTRPP